METDAQHASTDSQRASTDAKRTSTEHARALRLAEATALGGLLLYAVFAPHSIAGAWIALSISILGWLARALLARRANCRRTPLDLPLLVFYAWSILSALLSAEPRISLLKLISVSSFLIFYLVRSLTEMRPAFASTVAALMIASGTAGALWSIFEVARGRGVVVEEIAAESPFVRDESLGVAVGDSVWRVNGRRVNSVAEIDEAVRVYHVLLIAVLLSVVVQGRASPSPRGGSMSRCGG